MAVNTPVAPTTQLTLQLELTVIITVSGLVGSIGTGK